MSEPTVSPWKLWRVRVGLTQDQAAEAAGISQSVISGIERGENTSLETARKLVSIYNVSAAEAGAALVGYES